MTVSIREVARAASVSVGTVSNVLNRPDTVSAETAERVRYAIERLGYVRNDAARQLRAGRSRSVGLVVRDVRNPFFTDIARGAENAAAAAGLTVLLANSDESSEREAAYIDLFEQQRVLGVLISPIAEDLHRLERLRDRGTPVVLVDQISTDPRFSSVAVDDVAGAHLAVTHLAEIGRRRLAFVGGPHSIPQVADRLKGAQNAAIELADVSLSTMPTESLTALAGRAAGARMLALPVAERPDAVFAANDLVAMGLLQALSMVGDVRVPDDIAIVGYDDIDFARAAVVPLTSIRQPSELIGRTAMQILLSEAANEDASAEAQQVMFQPELVVRESTAGRHATKGS